MATFSSRYFKHLPPVYNYKDEERNVKNYIEIMLARTNMMFEYDNFPETMPPSVFELMLQMYGSICVAKVPRSLVLRNNQMDLPLRLGAQNPDDEDGTEIGEIAEDAPELYAFRCEFGGEPDIYYRPTKAIIANAALRKSLELEIGKECVMVKNDVLCQGLLPMFARYAFEMHHVDVSFFTALVNSRMQTRIVANNGKDFEAATEYIRKLTVGDLSAISSKPFMDGIQFADIGTGSNTVVTQLLDLIQYLKLSWYNDLGIDPNISNKREYVSAEQLASSTDTLMPLVDNMLECRIQAIAAINELFGTQMEVRKASSWKEKELETVGALIENEENGGLGAENEGGDSDDSSDTNDD